MAKKALIILADGFEEIEAISVIDTLRRSSVQISVCSLEKNMVTGSHNIKVQPDLALAEFKEDFDALILPGGSKGANNLAASSCVNQLIKQAASKNKIIAAICASPAVVLAPLGILEGKKATCFPGMQNLFPKSAVYKETSVVVDNHLITSRGPATAIEFALKIVEQLIDQETALKVKRQLLAWAHTAEEFWNTKGEVFTIATFQNRKGRLA